MKILFDGLYFLVRQETRLSATRREEMLRRMRSFNIHVTYKSGRVGVWWKGVWKSRDDCLAAWRPWAPWSHTNLYSRKSCVCLLHQPLSVWVHIQRAQLEPPLFSPFKSPHSGLFWPQILSLDTCHFITLSSLLRPENIFSYVSPSSPVPLQTPIPGTHAPAPIWKCRAKTCPYWV